MDLAPVVARLEAHGIAGIEMLAALSLIEQRPPAGFPAYYVAPEREAATAPRRVTDGGIHDQEVPCDFVVLVLVQAGGINPAAADAELAAKTATIEQALAGWRHPDADGTATAFLAGRLLPTEPSILGWIMTFRTLRRIRVEII